MLGSTFTKKKKKKKKKSFKLLNKHKKSAKFQSEKKAERENRMYKYAFLSKSLSAVRSPLAGLLRFESISTKIKLRNYSFPARTLTQTLCLHTNTQNLSSYHPTQSQQREMKYVLVTGGVVSGLGKGVTASSIGVVLKACGLRVTSIKIGSLS